MDVDRKAKAQLKRDEIKKYIQEERDTVLKRWMALEQQVGIAATAIFSK